MANRKELETGYKLELYNKADESAEKAGVYTIDNEVCDKVYVECEQMTRDIISGLIFSEEDKGKSKEKLEDLKNMAEKAGSEKVMEKCEKYSAINSQFILAEKK